jgi:hypothetical protein
MIDGRSNRGVSSLRPLDYVCKKYGYIVFALLLILYFAIFYDVPIQEELTPDSRLYLGLAQNLINGTGFHDTIRNDEILPPIGHPLLVAIPFWLGLPPPTITDWFLALSICFLALAIRVSAQNNIFVILFLLVYHSLLRAFQWNSVGVESSILLTSSLVVFLLVYAHKSRFSFPRSILLGVGLSISLLVRPLLLYPLIILWAAILAFITYRKLRGHVISRNLMSVRWLFLTTTALAIVGYAWVHSVLVYGDERFVTGTYGAIGLYCANNKYLPPTEYYYWSGIWKYLPQDQREEALAKLQNTNGWKDRHTRLVNETLAYVRAEPNRAFQGWLWRLTRYFGFPPHAIQAYSLLMIAFVILLILRLILAFTWSASTWTNRFTSPGILVSLLFFIQSGAQASFVYTGPRYLTHVVPWLASSCFLLLVEIIGLFRQRPAAKIR